MGFSRVGFGVAMMAGLVGAAVASEPPAPPIAEVAEEEAPPEKSIEELEAELGFVTGDVVIGEGLATVKLGDGFRFLGPAASNKVLVDVWGNPPGDAPLGMIFPADVGPYDLEGWGVIITYAEDGYVKDDDAADLDYDELLSEMKKDTLAENESRRAQGYEEVQLLAWAEPPHYDKSTHRLYWAKELAFGTAEEHTLNYCIRVLGRRGVLELNAVAGMSQLGTVKAPMETLLGAVEFQSGHRYEEFDSSIDKVATYGIGGLIAGKVLAKAGFFAIILKFLIAAKKLLVLGAIGVALALKRLFRGGDERA